MNHRLTYEFSRLTQTTSSGFASTAYPMPVTGTSQEGSPWFLMDAVIEQPDETTFVFGIETDEKELQEQISSLALARDITSSINIFGDGYRYIRDWLIDHPDAPINSVLVKVTDTLCGVVMGYYQVESEQLRWCDGGECTMGISLEEYTPKTNCLQNTFIWDNHQGLFPPDGVLPDNIHPRYRYCDDIKPQLLQNFIFSIAQGINILIGALTVFVVGVFQAIQWIINQIGGSGTADFADQFQQSVEDLIGDVYETIIGCGRKHPAPFLRTYFNNACDKCGLTFESNILNGDTVNGKAFPRYYNTSLLYAPEDKGVKEDSPYYWLQNNRPNFDVPLLSFMLKDVFNAKYGIEGDKFYFNRKDTFPPDILFDFTGSDANYILDAICYNTNTRDKRYQATAFNYVQDAQDMSGNDARHRYNGVKIWSTDDVRYKGTKKIEIDNFSVARFTNDGVQQRKGFKDLNNSDFFPDSTLLLEKDALGLGKLIIWDGTSPFSEAEVTKIDVLDMYFVSQWVNTDYAAEHITNIQPNEYFVYNHPMYFDPLNGQPSGGLTPYENLYNMHSIDNPTNAGLHNEFWNVRLELCCPVLRRVIADSADGVIAHIDHLVQLRPNVVGSIEQVQIVYGDGPDKNYIEFSGVVSYQL